MARKILSTQKYDQIYLKLPKDHILNNSIIKKKRGGQPRRIILNNTYNI